MAKSLCVSTVNSPAKIVPLHFVTPALSTIKIPVRVAEKETLILCQNKKRVWQFRQ